MAEQELRLRQFLVPKSLPLHYTVAATACLCSSPSHPFRRRQCQLGWGEARTLFRLTEPDSAQALHQASPGISRPLPETPLQTSLQPPTPDLTPTGPHFSTTRPSSQQTSQNSVLRSRNPSFPQSRARSPSSDWQGHVSFIRLWVPKGRGVGTGFRSRQSRQKPTAEPRTSLQPQQFSPEGRGPPRANSRPAPHLYIKTVAPEASVLQHFINASLHLVF